MAKWIEVTSNEEGNEGNKVLVNVEQIQYVADLPNDQAMIELVRGFIYTKNSYIDIYEKIHEAR